MAKNNNLTDFLTGVADAIRARKGTTAKINPQNFETEISSITASKPEQEKTTDLSMLSGNQIVSPDSGKVLSKVTITKPATLTSENIRKDTNIGGVIGTLEEAKPEQEKTTDLSMLNGNQIVSPDSGKVLSKVTITKPATLTSENIRKDTNIGGVIGTLEEAKPEQEKTTDLSMLNGNQIVSPDSGKVLSKVTITKPVTLTPKNIKKDTNIGGVVGTLEEAKPEQEKTAEATNGRQTILPDSGKTLSKVIIKSAPLPTFYNYIYKYTNGCLITKDTKTLLLGCEDSVIPTDNSVTSIGEAAFYQCRGLTSIKIPDSVTSIGKDAFSACRGLTSVTIGNSVTSIGYRAFYDCSGLTSVTIPDSVVSISESAFENCYNLKYNEYDNGYYLGNSNNPYVALIKAKNTSISSCIINENTKVIYSNAFKDCNRLTSVIIPDSVTSIDERAFSSCSGLTSVTIGNSVTSIGKNAFFYCRSLTSVTIPDSVTSIGKEAFRYCSGLTSVTIGNSVTSIGEWAFRDCSGLTSVTIGNSVTSIGELAFRDCSGLTNVTIPDSVTSIGKEAFASCSGLTSVTIGNSVTSIGGAAFWNCRSLTSVTIPDSVTSIGSGAFSRCSGLTDVTIGSSVTSIGAEAFWGCSGLIDVTIPNSVASIDENAFGYCDGIESFVVTPGNTKYHSANNCIIETESKTLISGCKNSVIPSDGSVTSIGGAAFDGCSGLTSITIPNSVTSIGERAFRDCSGLTNVTIPDSVTSIGEDAFKGCDNLKYNGYDNGYYLGNSNNQYVALIKAKDISISSCRINENTKVIYSNAFKDCNRLTSVIIPDSVTSIGAEAFASCSGLTSITIPDSVTSIGRAAFAYSGLTSVTIPDSVTSIGYGAFLNCSKLKNITIPDSVTSIGEQAFWGCSSLISVTIGNSVTSIGKWAFRNCSGLTNVIMLPTNPPTLGSDAIPSNVTTITVPVGCGDAYKIAAGWSAYADKIVEATA